MSEGKHACTCWTDPYKLDPVCLEHSREVALIAQQLARAKNGDEYDRSTIGYARVLRNEVLWAVPVVKDFIDVTVQQLGQFTQEVSVKVGAYEGAVRGVDAAVKRVESTQLGKDRPDVLEGLRLAQQIFANASKHAVELVNKEQSDG